MSGQVQHQIVVGYMPYSPENSQARFIAFADGTFVLELWRQDIFAQEPKIQVAIYAAGKTLVMLERDGQHVFRREKDGQAIHYLIISGPITQLPVGTYTVEAVVNSVTTVQRYVTIPDSPFTSGSNSGFYADIIPTDALLKYFEPAWIDSIRQRLLLLENDAVRTGISEW
jgi:hypothetical protein